MSREKINICDRCKIARKKSYQRKYMALKSTYKETKDEVIYLGYGEVDFIKGE